MRPCDSGIEIFAFTEEMRSIKIYFQMPIKNDKNISKPSVSKKNSNKTSGNASDRTGQRTHKQNFLDIATLIRSIQRAEGQTDCFKMGMGDCDQVDCKWRTFCL
jgi:hypothetical protein